MPVAPKERRGELIMSTAAMIVPLSANSTTLGGRWQIDEILPLLNRSEQYAWRYAKRGSFIASVNHQLRYRAERLVLAEALISKHLSVRAGHLDRESLRAVARRGRLYAGKEAG